MSTAFHRLRRHYATTMHLFIPLILFGMAQSFVGASIPLLNAALSPSDFLISAHFFVYASGRIISGPLAAAIRTRQPCNARIGPAAELLSASALLISMAVLFSFYAIAWTVVASFFIGLFAGLLHVLIQLRINQVSSEAASAKFAEAYLWVSIGVFFFPFWLGLILAASLPALYSLALPLAFGIAIVALFLSGRFSDQGPVVEMPPETEAAKTTRLTPTAWKLLGLVAVNSCFEWSFGFWGSYYAQSRFSLAPSQSVAIMSAYFLMTIAGRLLNIPILRLLPPIVAYRMYAAIAFGLLLVIFAVPSLSVFVVLFPLVGLVSGCLFPTNLALASSWLIGEFRAFIARSTVVGGVSLLLFPLILGSLAQITNIEFAFAAVSIGSLLVVMALLTVLRSQKT